MANQRFGVGVGCLLAMLGGGVGLRAEVVAVPRLESTESPRLERAKDLIADEQWARAVEELRAAAADPKEPNKDEALFWLAHSQNQTKDAAAAVQTIGRLEIDYPRSRWVKPAQSLRLEIAQRLRRSDVLWWTAVPPPPPASPAPAAPVAVPPAPPFPPAPGEVPTPRGMPPMVPPRPAKAPAAAMTPMPPPPPPPPKNWVPDDYRPDNDLRIQALGSLMRTDGPKVIPLLKAIALESDNPGESRRALFVLAQSGRPDARSSVVEVAMMGPEPVKIAAVRELGRVGGEGISNDLLQVYTTGTPRVKSQVVTALGRRDATVALMRIVQSETDRDLRDSAIVMLGESGGLEQLRVLYVRGKADLKRPIILGLFNAQAEDVLIGIADRERDPAIRAEVLKRLKLLGTPGATAYLARVKEK